jgi:hypothetical protein
MKFPPISMKLVIDFDEQPAHQVTMAQPQASPPKGGTEKGIWIR